MTLVPINYSTAIILSENDDQMESGLSFLFKVAFNFAKNGFLINVLTHSTIKEVALDNKYYLKHPGVLERIYFRYFSTTKEVLSWCHNIQNLRVKPQVIVMSMDDFCDYKDFEILNVSSAVISSVLCLSTILKTKHVYFLATINIKFNLYVPSLLTLYNNIWHMRKINSTSVIEPFNFKKSDDEFLQINIDDLTHDGILNIFKKSSSYFGNIY